MDNETYDRIFQKRKVIDEFYKGREEDATVEMSDSDSYDDIPDILSKYRNHGIAEEFCFGDVYPYNASYGSRHTLQENSTCVRVDSSPLSKSEIVSFPQKKSRLNWTRLFEKSRCNPIQESEGIEHENFSVNPLTQTNFRKIQSEPDFTKQTTKNTSSTVQGRLGCRRLALDNPYKLPLSQERRERLEEELESRRKNLKRRISQRVLSVLLAEAEVDLI